MDWNGREIELGWGEGEENVKEIVNEERSEE